MSILSLFVTSENNNTEKRFDKGITIAQLKERLEPLTGFSSEQMKIELYTPENALIAVLDDDSKFLGYYPVSQYCRIHVINTDPYHVKNEFSDVSRVEKYEMEDKEYEKRQDTVRRFKQIHKLGRFADKSEEKLKDYAEEASKITVGERCEVQSDDGWNKRGVVKFVGLVEFKPGYWVGVEFDEPIGKHSGTVDDIAYFSCRNKHGAFIRPDKVAVGDFPEETFDDDFEEI